MAEYATLARPYAKAAFDHAAEVQQLDQWASELALVSSIIQDEAFQEYLSRPQLTLKQQLDAVHAAAGHQLSPHMGNFVAQLAENDRLALFPFIHEEYERLKASGLSETVATIETAYPLTPEQLDLIRLRLEARFGTRVNLTEKVNPELIAGAIIRTGDQVIDDSVAGKLEQMRIRLLAS